MFGEPGFVAVDANISDSVKWDGRSSGWPNFKENDFTIWVVQGMKLKVGPWNGFLLKPHDQRLIPDFLLERIKPGPNHSVASVFYAPDNPCAISSINKGAVGHCGEIFPYVPFLLPILLEFNDSQFVLHPDEVRKGTG
jgi:hypothetical protein